MSNISGGTIQSGTYFIQNVATNGYLYLEGDNDDSLLRRIAQNDVEGIRVRPLHLTLVSFCHLTTILPWASGL